MSLIHSALGVCCAVLSQYRLFFVVICTRFAEAVVYLLYCQGFQQSCDIRGREGHGGWAAGCV